MPSTVQQGRLVCSSQRRRGPHLIPRNRRAGRPRRDVDGHLADEETEAQRRSGTCFIEGPETVSPTLTFVSGETGPERGMDITEVTRFGSARGRRQPSPGD